MFESPGQSGRPTLQANAVRGPSPGPRPRSRSVSPSRGQGSSSMGGRGFVASGGYQNSGRGRGWNGTGRPVVMQRNIATEETVKAVVPPVTSTRSSTPFATSPMEEWAQSASTQVPTCMYCGQRGHWMMGCAERLANEAKTMAAARGGTEMKGGSKHLKLEGTGPGADPVHATGPESSRGKKLIWFGKLFGLQDIYDGDEERVRGGGRAS